jgi:hypothetical protein
MLRDGSLTLRGLIGPTLLAASVLVYRGRRSRDTSGHREGNVCLSVAVLEHRECQKLPAGTEVDIVSGDEFLPAPCVRSDAWGGAGCTTETLTGRHAPRRLANTARPCRGARGLLRVQCDKCGRLGRYRAA